ncbi:EamA family transporter RarD [Tianweitania sediminis]|uniref:EamA family transporter RarD n=1 Tax=Tianweitania sediminis TaxID=1502156 RepID=A0A8J7R1K1_9HYPH|nr:EamA family transporter RarD [Tianweitania sediminis]MBP0438973.1 EamA family transporter RarD [Tianweitania sediminis]
MSTHTLPIQNTDPARSGFFLAVAAYFLWGFLPLYMKAVAHIPTVEVVAHRALWSVPIAGLAVLWMGRLPSVRLALTTPRVFAMALLTAAIISVNWGIYVWAIAADRTVEAALGYYINPLFSVFLAAVLLGEKLTKAQIVAIGLAAAAVAVLTWERGGLPWVSVALAVSWGFYAMFKRALPIGANEGFFLEVLIISVPAAAYLAWLTIGGQSHFLDGPAHLNAWLLAASGLATACPLLLYANGAKLLKLSTIGMMQYIAPSIIFLLAVFWFREPFSGTTFIAFLLIWCALVVFTWSAFFRSRKAG